MVLIEAIKDGKLEFAKYILDNNLESVDVKDEDGDTALMIASNKCNTEIAIELLKHGANKEEKDSNGSTPLIIASFNGSLEIVIELLGYGANINAEDDLGYTSLMFASRNGHEEVVNELLEQGAIINHPNKDGDTALIYASFNGYIEIVIELLKYGANIQHKNSVGCDAIDVAEENGHDELVDLLNESKRSQQIPRLGIEYKRSPVPIPGFEIVAKELNYENASKSIHKMISEYDPKLADLCLDFMNGLNELIKK